MHRNGLPLEAETVAEIRRLAAEGKGTQEIARLLGIGRPAVRKYRNQAQQTAPAAQPETPVGASLEPQLPEPIERDTSPLLIEEPGCYWVFSDVHLPFHDRLTLELGADKARAHGIKGILINGDLLDCLGLSSKFHKRPDEHTFKLERQHGLQLFAWLRYKFPAVRIVWKLGNHEERLEDYLARKAQELFDLPELSMESLLQCEEHRVQVVKDQRTIKLGKLPVLHGHEYRAGISEPVNPARGMLLRALHTVLVGHWHRPSSHTERDVTGKIVSTWSVGCACTLKPRWAPFNKWGHGFALVELAQNGTFSVLNCRVQDGEVKLS